MKIAVITALSGRIGAQIQDPINGGFPNTDYYAFVDRPHKTEIWQQLPLYDFSSNTGYSCRINAKLPKVLSWLLLPGYDYYLWHDNICDLQLNPEDIIHNWGQNCDIALFKHPDRSCSYDEIREIGKQNKDSKENLHRSEQFLIDNNWPTQGGLFELTSFVYQNTPKMRQAMLLWWELICRYTSRDQVMFPFVLHKNNIIHNYLPGKAREEYGNTLMPVIRHY